MGKTLYETGVRALVDDYMLERAKEERDYGDYWSASSAGYCQRKIIFDRLKVPNVKDDNARKLKVFEVGHIFHQWMQEITKEAGFSVAQEVELQNEDVMVRGHFDDLILVDGQYVLYDYKTQNSRAFTYQKGKPMSHYHTMQLGTYLYMINTDSQFKDKTVNEGRICKISKDDLRMTEQQLFWTPELEAKVLTFWNTLNNHWKSKTLPACTCADYEGGFMAKEAYNPYYFEGEPCSIKWYENCKAEGLV